MNYLKSRLITILQFCLIVSIARSQDTLPSFSLWNAGNNRYVIGWTNRFEHVSQIIIQRSKDSLSGFRSILTVADPAAQQNGYLDAKSPGGRIFYRLFIVFKDGNYIFSAAKKAPAEVNVKYNFASEFTDKEKPIVINPNRLQQFSDSGLKLSPITYNKIRDSFVPSLYIFTCSDGYVCIKLPDKQKTNKYVIKFYDDEGLLFELKNLKVHEFKLDKTNFYRSGWFQFELFEGDALIERHKFYLEKEF
ncbi:MAG: hypothetical protein N2747_08645 [Chitinophagaceae bacterium]|nr:hypothetical protein [Chitinophagaceae bacterium]